MRLDSAKVERAQIRPLTQSSGHLATLERFSTHGNMENHPEMLNRPPIVLPGRGFHGNFLPNAITAT